MTCSVIRSPAPAGKAFVIDNLIAAAREILKPKSAYVVHEGEEMWPMEKGVTAVSLVALMSQLADG
jgi:hypothetical protein